MQRCALDCQLRKCFVYCKVIRIGTPGDTQQYIGIHKTSIDHHLLMALVKALAGEGLVGKLGDLL
jgi:hypothetical protein